MTRPTPRHLADNQALGTLLDHIADLIADRVAARIGCIPASGSKLLTIDEAAELMGRSPTAVRGLVARCEIAAVRSGRRVHIHTSQLEAFIERNRTD